MQCFVILKRFILREEKIFFIIDGSNMNSKGNAGLRRTSSGGSDNGKL